MQAPGKGGYPPAHTREGRSFSRPGRAIVERERELDILWKQFERVAAGHIGVAVVAGEPGIGKTRLLTEQAARTLEAGARVVHGGASDAEGMPPYLPFLEALGPYIMTAPLEELRRATGPVAGILAAIFPELTVRLGDRPVGQSLPAGQARFRLFEAVGSLLAAIAESAPLVVILDDLQWADADTLAMLCHIVRHNMVSSILILGAYRQAEGGQNPALARTLVDLNRLRVLETMGLRRLSVNAVAAMGSSDLGGPLEPAAIRQLYAHSEGNPFFTEEIVRAWLESGDLAETHGRWGLVGTAEARLPAGIAGIIRQRLSHLTEDVVECLYSAAVLGHAFEATHLAEVVGLDVETLEVRMGPALLAQLVREDGNGRYAFNHDKIRECLYEDITRTRRRRLHGLIGQTLESSGDGSGLPRLSELAFHFVRSNDRARGAMYTQRAADQAMGAYAFEEAAVHYRDLLDLLDPTDEARGRFMLLRANAALLAERNREAIAAFEGAQAWFLERGHRVESARAAYGLGRAWWRLEEFGPARLAFTAALEVLRGRPEPETVQILVDFGTMLAVSLGLETEGIAYGREALAMARGLGDERLEAAPSRVLGNLLVRSNDLSQGLPLLERALALARTHDDPREAAECCSCLHNAYLWSGRLQQAHTMVQTRLEYARRCHEPFELRHTSSWLLLLLILQGELRAAEDMAAQAQQAIDQLASPEPAAFLLFGRGLLAAYRGDYDRAERLMSEALVTFRTMGPAAVSWYLGLLPWVQAAAGKREEAARTIDEIEGLLRSIRASGLATADLLSGTAAAVVILQDRDRAERYYRQLLPFRGLWISFPIDRLLGGLATLRRDWNAADRHLTSAEDSARREGIGPELARSLQWRAELEVAQSSRRQAPGAGRLLEEAYALFVAMDMSGEAQAVQTRLSDLSGRSRDTRPALPAGLSRREAEVLRLVATGKTNREIAGDLFLSEKTVMNHLTSIFNKTGSNNRVAATTFAMRHGLAE